MATMIIRLPGKAETYEYKLKVQNIFPPTHDLKPLRLDA